jgi:hypothetical protein
LLTRGRAANDRDLCGPPGGVEAMAAIGDPSCSVQTAGAIETGEVKA